MGRLREAAEAHAERPATCVVAITRQRLTGDDLADFDSLLLDSAITASNLASRIGDLGFYISDKSIARHRTGGCKCQR